MKLSEAVKIRNQIVNLCPDYTHKARNISVRVMRSLANEREDIACAVLGGREHLAHDYEIDERYAVKMRRALARAKGEKNDISAS